MKGVKHRGPGRPVITIDWSLVNQMAEAGCSGMEIAAHMGIHEQTLYSRCRKKYKEDYSNYSVRKRAKGNALLKVKQYESAVKDKNITMQIWLGKQRLGQKEKIEADINNRVESIEFVIKRLNN